MAQGFLISSPRMRFWDADGEVLAFGKLYFYEAGSTTPQDTWSNSDLTSLNTNPVILSASGECTVFVPDATLYKVDLFDANNVHQAGWPVDGVEAIPAPDPPAPTPGAVPSGGIIQWVTSTAPTGYLLCNGAAVSRATYSTLNTLLSAAGYPFGNGDASTTFNVPDMRGRFPLGVSASGTGSTLGGTGGAIDHTHTGPNHTHTVDVTVAAHTHTVTAAAHTHTTAVPRNGWGSTLNTPAVTSRMQVGNAGGVAEFASAYQATADQTVTSSADGALAAVATSSDGAISSTFTSAAGGTGVTGTANAPFCALWFIIKV